MTQISKRFGSLLLAASMIISMIPTIVFAEDGTANSGETTSKSEITAFEELAQDVALQEVVIGTSVNALNLPKTMKATLTTFTTVSAGASGSQETSTVQEVVLEVSAWNSTYDDSVEDDYTFTPVLDLQEGTLAQGVTPPQITVTVVKPATPIMRGAGVAGTYSPQDIAVINNIIANNGLNWTPAPADGSAVPDDWLGVTWSAEASNRRITKLDIKGERLTGTLNVSGLSELVTLACNTNKLTELNVSGLSKLTFINAVYSQLTYLDATGTTALTPEKIICHDQRITLDMTGSNGTYSASAKFGNGAIFADGALSYANETQTLTSTDPTIKSVTFDSPIIGKTRGSLIGTLTLRYPTYSVTANGGTAISEAQVGETVTIQANTPEGKLFKGWSVISGGVSLADPTKTTTTFVMPNNAVEVTANFEDTYSITVQNDGNGTATSGVDRAPKGAEITLTAVPNSGYDFKEWTVVSGGVSIADPTNATSATFTMPNNAVEVTATFDKTPPPLSITPSSYTFDPLEKDYNFLEGAKAKTFTITNTGKTTLTGVEYGLYDSTGGGWLYLNGSIPSTLAPNQSFEVTLKPHDTLGLGSYTCILKVTSKEGVEASAPISLEVIKTIPRLKLGDTMHKLNADFSGTGYSWSAASNALTLTSAYNAGRLNFMYPDDKTINVKLAGDVTIAVPVDQGRSCIDADQLAIDLGGHTLSLSTGGKDNSAIDARNLTIQNGNLTAHLRGNTNDETSTIMAKRLIVENATVTADAERSNYGGIEIGTELILKKGANVTSSGYYGLKLGHAALTIESDDVSLVAIRYGTPWIDLSDVVLPQNSKLRYWTNDYSVPPTHAGEGALLSSLTEEQLDTLWNSSRYMRIAARSSDVVVTGIAVKSQPSNLGYYEGDLLNLSGLVATLRYSDGSTKDVSYTDFAANTITMNYGYGKVAKHGDRLTLALNGETITLTTGSHRAQTQALTINPRPENRVVVTNGTGSGKYFADSVVLITADAAPEGKRFDGWVINPSNVDFISGTVSTQSAKFFMPEQDVTATAKYVDLNPDTYAVNILNDGYGRAYANVAYAVQGDEIVLTTEENNGYYFKEWQVISGGVTINGNKFIMPAQNVTIKAVFQYIQAEYTVTFDPNGGTRTGGGELTQIVDFMDNFSATAPTVTRSGYTFKGWDKSFTDVTSDLTVMAVWQYNGGGGSSDDDDDSDSNSNGNGNGSSYTTPATGRPLNQLTGAWAAITATIGANGTASASISDKIISDAIAIAQADAKLRGGLTSDLSVGLNLIMPTEATSLRATLSRSSLNNLVSAGVTNLEIAGSPVTLGLNQRALAGIQRQFNGNVMIFLNKQSDVPKAAQNMIGGRPLIDIRISDANNREVSRFDGGMVTVAIPYTLGKNEAAGGLYAVYVDGNGNPSRINGSAYDTNSGCMIFTTPHLSMYGIGYTAPTARFTDISNHWAKESIDYVVGRGLINGATKTTFEPDTAMTRGALATALGKLAGVDTKAYTTRSFEDVGANNAYRPYIEWAYGKGIIQSAGNNQFAPDKTITREELAAVMASYAKASGYTLPVTREGVIFTDASSIGSTYKTAIATMQQAGVMMSGSSNKFNPKSNATRAEVSAMLHRYIKLTLNPATADGWSLNDAGQYLYYKNGKSITGWQDANGIKYYFNSLGIMQTGWASDGESWRYYSGNKVLVGWQNFNSNKERKTYYFKPDGSMVSGSWMHINGKWYYFYADGSLAKSTKIDEYEVDKNGVRKTK